MDRRHTTVMLGLPGDRRDEDLLATMQETRSFADEYVLFDLTHRRGASGG